MSSVLLVDIVIASAIGATAGVVSGWLSGRRTRQEGLRRYLVEAHDKKMEDFANRYKKMMEALGDVGNTKGRRTALMLVGVFRSHSLCGGDLASAIDDLANLHFDLTRPKLRRNKKKAGEAYDKAWYRLAEEIQKAEATADGRRDKLVTSKRK